MESMSFGEVQGSPWQQKQKTPNGCKKHLKINFAVLESVLKMGYSRNRISAYHYQESEVYIIESKSGFYDQKSIMEINLKDTLRNLRRAKNITQETLADYLGITPQSVGKWERGEGYPDITMLPKIAIYFDVTVDELLDVGKSRIQEKIKQCQEESAKYKNAGENEKNLALWEEAYSEFPNECEVMSELMSAIY